MVPRAYLIFDGTLPIAFVADIRGYWRRTHGCVLVAACTYCNAAVGDCCTGANGQRNSSTHHVRRTAASAQLAALRKQSPRVTIIVNPGAPPAAATAPVEEVPDAKP